VSRHEPAFSAPIAAPADSLPRTLDAVLDRSWQRIAGALDGRWTSWGLPTLVTVRQDGAPRARVLALRAVEPRSRRFTFHTDARSDKVADIVHEPRVSLLFWDRDDAVQVRFDGTASVHRADPVATAAWRSVSALRRSACDVALAPGARLPAATRFDALPVVAGDDLPIRHFAVVVMEATMIDWLWLGPHDLRRARFTCVAGEWFGAWVAP